MLGNLYQQNTNLLKEIQSVITTEKLELYKDFPNNYVQSAEAEQAYQDLMRNLPEYLNALQNEAS